MRALRLIKSSILRFAVITALLISNTMLGGYEFTTERLNGSAPGSGSGTVGIWGLVASAEVSGADLEAVGWTMQFTGELVVRSEVDGGGFLIFSPDYSDITLRTIVKHTRPAAAYIDGAEAGHAMEEFQTWGGVSSSPSTRTSFIMELNKNSAMETEAGDGVVQLSTYFWGTSSVLLETGGLMYYGYGFVETAVGGGPSTSPWMTPF